MAEGNGAAPVTAEHPELDRVLPPLRDGYAAEAEAAIATPPARAVALRPENVEPIHCRAFFKGDMRTVRNGVIEVTMQLPWEYRSQAFALLDLTGYPMELYLRPAGPR